MKSENTPLPTVDGTSANGFRARFAGPGFGRRSLLRAGLTGAAAVGAGVALGAAPAVAAGSGTSGSGTDDRPVTAEEALTRLARGNQRWRTSRQTHPHESPSVRQSLTSGQHPFALVLGCIDSRVPPELVFDQGLGDLMTVRAAGQVLDEAVLGSVAYGVLELAIPLVVVLGHQSCGAVRAAVESDESGKELPAHIEYVAAQIRPNIDHTKSGDARIDATIDSNVRAIRSHLAAEADLAEKISAGELTIVGARYELNTQRVHSLA